MENATPKINKRAVARVLETMGKQMKGSEYVRKVIRDKNGNLDIIQFNLIAEELGTFDQLRKLGVRNSHHLADLGFIPAGMVLKF